jgi:3-oxoadipate enol-lactonase
VPETAPFALHVREAGTGPNVVLLHGLGGDHTQWNHQIGALARSCRVLAPDLRGHGRTPAPDGSTFSLEEMGRDLGEMLAALGVDSAHFVGTSAGGFLALRFALDHPERVQSLALLSSAAHCDGHTKSVVAGWAEAYRDEGFDAYVLHLMKDLYAPDWLEAHMESIDAARTALRGRDLKPIVLWAQALRGFDVRSHLGRMRVPTYAVHGMDDRVIDPSHSRLLRQAIRGAELKLFPFAGHMLTIERSTEVTELLQAWFPRAGRPPGPTDPSSG